MHMANELLSVPVAASTLGIAAIGLGAICKRLSKVITSDKMALMGIMGAFVFAAQMVNFQVPAMPGTSGHMIGAVLLAIMLGPAAGTIVISSVVIIQCLIFQDGGLLALGCNIINMAIVPSYLGYYIYKAIAGNGSKSIRIYIGTMIAALAGLLVGAVLVVLQASLSGVLVVPTNTFLLTMVGVHFIVGLVEGFITVAVLGYIQQLRPDILGASVAGTVRLSRKTVLVTLAVFAIIISGGLSLLASGNPDGLEWSYAERPDQPEFTSMISNENQIIAKTDELQSAYSPLPDYSLRNGSAAGWTSFAGIIGSILTMAFIWILAKVIRRSKPQVA